MKVGDVLSAVGGTATMKFGKAMPLSDVRNLILGPPGQPCDIKGDKNNTLSLQDLL